jgi:hypothetical protein
MQPISIVQGPVLTQAALPRFHVFNAPRPWIFSQWYLPEQARPVDLGPTMALLAAASGLGMALMCLGTRRRILPRLAGDGRKFALQSSG